MTVTGYSTGSITITSRSDTQKDYRPWFLQANGPKSALFQKVIVLLHQILRYRHGISSTILWRQPSQNYKNTEKACQWSLEKSKNSRSKRNRLFQAVVVFFRCTFFSLGITCNLWMQPVSNAWSSFELTISCWGSTPNSERVPKRLDKPCNIFFRKTWHVLGDSKFWIHVYITKSYYNSLLLGYESLYWVTGLPLFPWSPNLIHQWVSCAFPGRTRLLHRVRSDRFELFWGFDLGER